MFFLVPLQCLYLKKSRGRFKVLWYPLLPTVVTVTVRGNDLSTVGGVKKKKAATI